MAWAGEPSIMTGDESSILTSSSSLQFINSQLVAHGYSHSPGISLDGLSNSDSERVVKSLLALLSQRMQDMETVDDLNTKTRTMGYDNDRLKSMHQVALDRASNAERETNTWKSRASAADKASQSSEKRFKNLAAENQRLRTTIQAVRTGAQTEIKKFEKEKDRLLERLGKIADLKPSAQFKCTNLGALNAAESTIGVGRGYLDIALEEAECARGRLAGENDDLRRLVVDCTNGLQDALHSARSRDDEQGMEDEPAPLTLAVLFPLAPHNFARDNFNSLLVTLREKLRSGSNLSTFTKQDDCENMMKLQEIVDKLRSELDQAQLHTSDYATQAQTLFDRFIEDKRLFPSHDKDAPETSIELMTVPVRDEERDRLQTRSKELENDRWKLTEAAVKLGNERAALEAQRLQFLEEKRRWEVRRMLEDRPPTPKLVSSTSTGLKQAVTKKAASPARRKSKTPAKKAAMARRSSLKRPAIKKIPLREQRRNSGLRTLEMEVIAMPPPSPPPSKEIIAKMTSVEDLLASCSQGPKTLVLPTEFVLPPPSPEASLPAMPKPANEQFALIPQFNLARSGTVISSVGSLPRHVPPLTFSKTSPPPMARANNAPIQPAPQTPRPNPFPIGRPMAARTVHAYSPVKPSPLSRILMLADDDSPPDSDELPEQPRLNLVPLARPRLAPLAEGHREAVASGSGSGKELTLEEELGIPMDEDYGREGRRRAAMVIEDLSPLREKNVRRSPSPRRAALPSRRPTTVVAVPSNPKPKSDAVKRAMINATTARDKGKGKEVEKGKPSTSRTRSATAAGLDKENTSAAKRLKPSPPDVKRPVNSLRTAPPAAAPGRTRSTTSVRAGTGPGPRRVPIGSSEAARR